MRAVGELVRCTDGRWMIRPPHHCPRGHRLSPGRVLVGHRVCSCGGHTTWTCDCGGVVYAPPLAPECRVLVGPAAVRTVREHFADKLFMSVKGLARDGSLTDPDPLECEVKRAMIERAEGSICSSNRESCKPASARTRPIST